MKDFENRKILDSERFQNFDYLGTHPPPSRGVRDTKQYIDWGELVRALLRGGGGGSWGGWFLDLREDPQKVSKIH